MAARSQLVTERTGTALLLGTACLLPTAAGFFLGLATVHEPALAFALSLTLGGIIFLGGLNEYRAEAAQPMGTWHSAVRALAGMTFMLSGLLGYGTALAYAARTGLQINVLVASVMASSVAALACLHRRHLSRSSIGDRPSAETSRMSAQHTSQDICSFRTQGNSNPRDFDADYLLTNGTALVEALAAFEGGKAEFIAFTPCYAQSTQEGAFVLDLKSANGKIKASVGIRFGSEEIGGAPLKRAFDRDSFDSDRENPFSTQLQVGNWDEAMACICYVGENLKLKEVRLRYGI